MPKCVLELTEEQAYLVLVLLIERTDVKFKPMKLSKEDVENVEAVLVKLSDAIKGCDNGSTTTKIE